ncbi:MAG TPA: penicillin-binding protein 1C [Steroidobacteraceae bacterium]|nr:penicillin-binding protein 1C [Steroidobacteraceae bacterium]
MGARPRSPALRRCFVGLIISSALLLAIRSYPHQPLSSRIPSSTAIFAADGQLLRLTMASDEQYRLWTPLDQIAPDLIEALLLHEDRSFYHHPGVNPVALLRAAKATYSGGARQGGSTITMQLARLLYDLDTRTIPGKIEQSAYALSLEARYSKRELLEAHLNLMPYGGNVQGVGAASLIYFGKPARALGLSEALSLVLIPQSPLRRDPSRVEPEELEQARLRLFARWQEAHPHAGSAASYVDVPLRYRNLKSMPFLAPHATQSLLAQAHPAESIHGTLQLPLQALAESVVRNYVREHADTGIHNASVLLLDYRDMSVRAVVGSANFFDATIAGQVNGTLAKRSPGSALKPFIYALAIDQGLIHGATVLKDAPTAFGAFSPENFDGTFIGPISATDALTRSRNVPAVALSARLSEPTFYGFLKGAGIARLASEEHYGLALALGGGEVTMEEVATLYAMLANRGVLHAPRYRTDQRLDGGTRLLSEEASFMTLDMLRTAPRPDEPTTSHRHLPVAWKTGTSWGFRDAWTAGVFGPYVLVVWTGNFDGRGNPVFVGVQAAAPLFFRLYDAILARAPNLYEPAFRQPPRLARVEVCRESGDLPNADCPHVVSTWYIPGTSPIKVSQVHRRLWIDTRTGEQACPPFDTRTVRAEVFEFWPSDLLQLFEKAGMPRRRPPDAKACQRDNASGIAPQITSPVLGATYTVRANTDDQSRVPLSATADSEVRRLHWFADNAYLGTSAPGIALPWQPAHSGRYTLRAVDDRGRADSRVLSVDLVR